MLYFKIKIAKVTFIILVSTWTVPTWIGLLEGIIFVLACFFIFFSLISKAKTVNFKGPYLSQLFRKTVLWFRFLKRVSEGIICFVQVFLVVLKTTISKAKSVDLKVFYTACSFILLFKISVMRFSASIFSMIWTYSGQMGSNHKNK